MDDKHASGKVPPHLAALKAVCPRCGRGSLFKGFLTLNAACAQCGLSYKNFEAADGPAVFIILIVGFIVLGSAAVAEIIFQPPMWLHMVIWLPMTVVLSLALLRPFKSLFISLQYRYDAGETRHMGS